MTDHDGDDRFSEWDAAYVLGTLSTNERREFEEHIRGCATCSNAVTELAAIPGLLRSLPADEALAMLDEDTGAGISAEPVSADILTGLSARVRTRRRVRTWTAGLAGVAAAAVVITGAAVLPDAVSPPAQPTTSAALRQLAPGPLTADVELTAATWGTSIEMTCVYHAGVGGTTGSTPGSTTRYGLYVTDKAGAVTRVSSWRAGPGDTVHTAGSIDIPISDIARVDVRSDYAGTVLLSRAIG